MCSTKKCIRVQITFQKRNLRQYIVSLLDKSVKTRNLRETKQFSENKITLNVLTKPVYFHNCKLFPNSNDFSQLKQFLRKPNQYSYRDALSDLVQRMLAGRPRISIMTRSDTNTSTHTHSHTSARTLCRPNQLLIYLVVWLYGYRNI